MIFRVLLLLGFAVGSQVICADPLASYMDIDSRIPDMQLKADANSHAWARSAKKVILMHDDAVCDSVNAMNALAESRGHALFCLPNGAEVERDKLHDLIVAYAKKIPTEEQKSITVAKVAIKALSERFPCDQSAKAAASTNTNNSIDSDDRFDFSKEQARMQSVRG